MTTREKRALYESIMTQVAREVKRSINDYYSYQNSREAIYENYILNEGIEDWKKKCMKGIMNGMLVLASLAPGTKAHAQSSVDWLQDGAKTEQKADADNKNAEFMGGANALMSYVNKNLKYPETAKDDNATGKTVIKFVIDGQTGKIKDAKVQRSAGNKELDQAALRLVNNMPKWKTAKKNGEGVDQTFSMPFTFTLTASK